MTGRSSFAACCIRSTSTRSTRRRCRMAHVGVRSDRNFYDRCYFNAHDRTGDVFLITGLGVYPNLGVIDAYVDRAPRRPPATVAVLATPSSADRMHQQVGPYRIEVVEPLQQLRLIVRRRRPRRRLRPHVGGLVPRGRRGAARLRQRRPRPCSTRSASPRSARGRAAARRRRHDRRRAGRLGRHPRPLLGHPPRRRRRAGRASGRREPDSTGSGGSTCRCASTTSRSS